MNHLMIDIETLGTKPGAAVVSIGAAFFDLISGEVGATFYKAIDLELSENGEIDPGTVKWWMRQSDEARAVFSDAEAIPSDDALRNLAWFIAANRSGKKLCVWGNGCTFDNVILDACFRSHGIERPWGNYDDRDVRTIVELGRAILGINPKSDIPFDGNQHNALDDVLHQVKYVSHIARAFSALNDKTSEAES